MAHPQTNFSSNFQGVDPPLEGYWHDDPIPCGSGNVVTDIYPNPAGVPVVVKGFNALTDEDIADKLDNTGDASNTTSTFTKTSGDTSSMTSGSKLSVIFTAISSFFASLKALAFKDKAAYSDLSSGVQSSLDKADSALQSHQSVTDNNPTLAWGTTSKVGTVGSTDLRVTMPTNPAQNLPASVITSGTFGTDRIADDAITAAKVKDNETLPVNIDGMAKSARTLIGENMVSGTNGYSLLATLKSFSSISAVYAGVMFAVVCRGGSGSFEGIVSVSLSEYTGSGNETAPIVGNVAVMNCRGANLDALTAKFDFYMLRIEAGKYQLYVHKKENSSPVSCTLLSATECTCTLYSSGTIANLPTAIETKKLDWICYKNVGSTTTPVYVDSNGQVQPCTQGSTLKSNTATLYIAGYTDNNIPIYHVKDIKNGCVNHVDFSGITNSTCDITFEAPTLSTGEEYDYVISLEGYTNNTGVSTGSYVENCKQVLRYDYNSNLWVGEGLFLQATDWRQICIVRGNTCEWKRVALS